MCVDSVEAALVCPDITVGVKLGAVLAEVVGMGGTVPFDLRSGGIDQPDHTRTMTRISQYLLYKNAQKFDLKICGIEVCWFMYQVSAQSGTQASRVVDRWLACVEPTQIDVQYEGLWTEMGSEIARCLGVQSRWDPPVAWSRGV